MIWKILGIEKTKDEEQIKEAYHNKLRLVNPEDDEEGFKELRRAYEEALDYANREETEEVDSEEESRNTGKKTEVDLWLDRIDAVYLDVATRIDEKKWDALLNDPVCDDLDTELEAAEKLLVYFMSHTFMPQTIWQLVEKRFHYLDDFEQLKERFPENYLEYVKWQIENPGFIDYKLFDGKTNDHVDDFISKLYETKSASDDRDVKRVKQLLKELGRYELTHPFTQVEEARCLLIEQEDSENSSDQADDSGKADGSGKADDSEKAEGKDKKFAKEALSIMEELDFEYSENMYVERIYAEALLANGEIDKARAVYDAFLEKDPQDYIGLLGQANCVFLAGDPEEAKEQIEDILEDRVQDAESLMLLDKVNEVLVKKYETMLETELNRDICFKLGWCYYQQKKFEKGIALLDRLENGEDYDYVNLRCRLYLASDQYDKAYPLAKKWLELIEDTEDDGTREMEKRKKRLSLALFSVGVCLWEIGIKTEESEGKQQQYEDAATYIQKALSKEDNTLVKLSYMEQLARFYLNIDECTKCIDICNEIIEQDRGFFPAYVHRQKAHYELKNAKEVIDDYFTCIELFPAYAPPYVLAAEVFFAFDQYDDVEHVIQAAKEAELHSDSLELYRIKCIHYKEFSKENVQKALKATKALREKIRGLSEGEETDIEDLADLEREYAVLYWDLDETEKALSIIENFLKKHIDNLIMLHLKADILLREDRYDEALEVCKTLVMREHSNLYTHLKFGNCYERMGDYTQAISRYTWILDKNPNFAPALRRLMYIYSFLSNREDNMEKCRLGVEYATRFIEAGGGAEGYVERGNLYIDLYELERAVEDCKKAIELDAEAYYAYNNLGCALLKLRRVDEAILPLEQAIAMEPSRDHLPYLNLAECYILSKEYDKAIQAYKDALKIRPNVLRWKKKIAEIYIMKKEYNKAIRIYQEQITAVGKDIKKSTFSFLLPEKDVDKVEQLHSLYCDLADAYRQVGNTEKVEECYKKVQSGYGGILHRGYCLSAMTEVAEYYRDSGQLEKAAKVIDKTLTDISDRQRGTYDYRSLLFTYTTVLFELRKRQKAEEYARLYLEYLFEGKGNEEKLLSDPRYRPMYLYDLAIAYICMGEVDKAEQYLQQIRDNKLCVSCETCDCFEYYFGMGLAAELKGKREEAIKLYKKAIEIKGDYPCAERHLRRLQE